jgi:hypothetical protein
VTDGIRYVPRGFVRDLFILAPIALTIVQWGLVRQLSYQPVLSYVWWPLAFVLVSTLIAAVVWGIALSSRPLTRRGAIIKQYLLGIDVYAEQTNLLDRGVVSERVLPYAVLLASPRTVGGRIVAMIEGELSETGITRGWLTRDFLTAPRLIIRGLSVLLVVGAIVTVATVSPPYPRSDGYISYNADVPGTIWSTVTGAVITGELGRTEDGRARIDATESLSVTFEDGGSSVPQFAQQWPTSLNGQALDTRVTAVRLDGSPVDFDTETVDDTLLLTTRLVDSLDGTFDLEIDYSVASAAVAASHNGEVVDRVRWVALLEGWDFSYNWRHDPPPTPLRIEFSLSDELADLGGNSGWISLDTDSADSPRDWEPSVVPFDTARRFDGQSTYSLALVADDLGGFPFDLTVDDVGASVDFPAGTFVGPEPAALQRARFAEAAPLLGIQLIAALAFIFGVAGTVRSVSRRSRVFDASPFRDLVRWFTPAATLATLILFIWESADMPSSHSAFPPLAVATVAALTACVFGLVFTRASKRPK